MSASSYIICATPRSGSTMLCDLLTATHVAGRPASYYRAQDITYWADQMQVPAGLPDGPAFERAYLEALKRYASNGTGTFGLRLMYGSLAELLSRLALIYPDQSSDRGLLEAALGSVTYLHLSRGDKLAQAISRLKAEQSGLWHRAADGSVREGSDTPGQPVYDFAALQGFIAAAQADDHAWNNWFARHGITPHAITYEKLAADPKTALRGVLNALGRDPALADQLKPQTARLADGISAEWAACFAHDSAKT